MVVSSKAREVTDKHPRIRFGEYLVYHFSAQTLVRCSPEGGHANGSSNTGYIFDDLAAARLYCQRKVSAAPHLGCLIYDSTWRISEQFFSPQHQEKVRRANSPRQQLVKGSAFLVFGSVLVWLDARHNWMLVVGFLIGARFVVGGLSKLMLGLFDLWTSRSSAKRSLD